MSLQEVMVKKLLTLILVLGIAPITAGQITVQMYEADGETPFDCNDDIMVGTELTIVVSSDSNDYWSGGLFISGQDRALGTLAGRGLDPNDPNARDYTDSHYEDAGDLAIATGWKDSLIWGFDLYTFYPVDSSSHNNSTVPGDWFIIDYKADDVGDCNVGFYDYSINWDDPNYFLSFSHSPTRDLNFDDKVNFTDFAIFASQWDATDCNNPNWCDGADLDREGNVDYNDLGLFVEYWLWEPNSGMLAGGRICGMDSGLEQPYMQSMQQPQSATQEIYPSQTTQETDVNEIETTQEIDVNDIVKFLEDIWLEENEIISQMYSEAEWKEFIESFNNPDW